ncbi:hypothetical protein D9M71_141390 [compost metagenome]
MPIERIGNGLEIRFGKYPLEVFEVGLDLRVLGTGQRWFEPRIFHQFPSWQVNAPSPGKPGLVAVLIAQLLEEGTLGRHIGGQPQGAIGQGVARLWIIAGAGPGQFVVGKIPNQPRVVTMVAGGDGHGAFGGHGKTRVEGIRHTAPPVGTRADAGVVTNNRQRQGIGHSAVWHQARVAPVTQGVETPRLQAVEGVALPALGIEGRWWASRRGSLVGLRGLDLGRLGYARFGLLRLHAGLCVGTGQVGGIEVVPTAIVVAAVLA